MARVIIQFQVSLIEERVVRFDEDFLVRTFDMSTRTNQSIWRTRVDDRVLCSRFTGDGQYFLVGTGGTSSLYPLILFDTERAQPIHVSLFDH
jgi:hypothetical protein